MEQTGYIVEVLDGNIAKFKMERESACAKCGKCFGAKTSESQELIVDVDNNIGAKIGDFVEVSMDQVNVMKAMGIVYGIPLLALVIGSVGTYYGLQNFGILGSRLEVYSFLVGMLFTAISYTIIRFKDSSFKDSGKYMPIITNIIVSDDIVNNAGKYKSIL